MNYAHQYKLFDPKCAKKVTLLGAGSVGSYVAFFLAKMGVTDIEVWDADSVASHNLPMSLYRPEDVGRPKVLALYDIIDKLTGVHVKIRRQVYWGEPLKNTSVVCCVDTMTARKLVWGQVKRNPSVDLFMDTRLSGAFVDVLTIDPSDREDIGNYEALWFSDEEARLQYCGEHGIVYGSTRAAGVVAANLTQFWRTATKKWRIAERCDTLERAI